MTFHTQTITIVEFNGCLRRLIKFCVRRTITPDDYLSI